MKKSNGTRQLSVLVVTVLFLAPAAIAARYGITTIDYPGARHTHARAINDAGDVVGFYTDAGGVNHAFLLRDGRFTSIDFPGARTTMASGINNGGDIVGGYTDAAGNPRGFLLSKGVFTSIDYPQAINTGPWAINNKGEVVGMYVAADNIHRTFIWSQGRFTSLEIPDARSMTCGFGINDDGVVVGHTNDQSGYIRGWMWRQGSFTLLEPPGVTRSQSWSGSYGIGPAGDIVGIYSDARGKERSYLLSRGNYTPLEVPGAARTRAFKVNRSSEIAGMYEDAGGAVHGFLMRPAQALPQVLMVDDDGADCPGALPTIQAAVERASAGAAILVCPGTYRRTVHIKGAAKNDLKLIAIGGEGEVTLAGDYTQRDGFLLEDVSGVLLRGFTVKDFGNLPTTETQWGTGNNIHLMNAHYNTIENNVLVDGDMMGIMLMNSGNNLIRNNVAYVTNPEVATCGIHVGGAASVNNFIRGNVTVGNQVAGIMLSGAGKDNQVLDNTVLSNGRFGITNGNSEGTRIEGNRGSYNRGTWSKTPWGGRPGIGVNVTDSTRVVVFDNKFRNNTGDDLNWDGQGANTFDANACATSNPAGACVR